MLAGYGTDMYVREYEAKLGTPWNNLDVYLRNSYPLLHADRIRTPTLFQCGENDFNVPLLISEQMYQALRSLGVETQLVIYPGQYHGLTRPLYLRDTSADSARSDKSSQQRDMTGVGPPIRCDAACSALLLVGASVADATHRDHGLVSVSRRLGIGQRMASQEA